MLDSRNEAVNRNALTRGRKPLLEGSGASDHILKLGNWLMSTLSQFCPRSFEWSRASRLARDEQLAPFYG